MIAYASMTEEDIRAGIRRLAECLPRGVASRGMSASDRAERIAQRAFRHGA